MHPPPQTLLQQPAHPTHLSGLQQAFWCACYSAFAFCAACASPSVSGTTSLRLLCLLASACSRLLLAASCLVCLYDCMVIKAHQAVCLYGHAELSQQQQPTCCLTPSLAGETEVAPRGRCVTPVRPFPLLVAKSCFVSSRLTSLEHPCQDAWRQGGPVTL